MPTPVSPYLVLGGLLAGWLIVVVVYASVSRARLLAPGPATADLGPEPPAVVNLLVTRCELTADAADATLLDLAARRIIELHQPGDDPAAFLVRVRDRAPADLTPYERRVFERVQTLAAERFVRIDEVTAQLADGGPRWLRHLRQEVVADARARGLVRSRQFGTPMVLFTVLISMVIACTALVPVLNPPGAPPSDLVVIATIPGWFAATVLLLVVQVFALALLLRTPGHTATGRAVGSRWLGVARWLTAHESLAQLPPAAVAVWDRHLAYGVALGVNPVASRAVDLRAGRGGPLRSRYTGFLRLVTVTYPRDPFAYSQAGLRIATASLGIVVWAGAGYLTARSGGWPDWLRGLLGLVSAVGGLRSLYRWVRAVHARQFPVTVTGQLLARHPFNPRVEGGSRWHQIVIDDGTTDRTRPWLIRTTLLGSAEVGAVVRIRAQPWTRYGLDITILAAPSISSGQSSLD